MSSFISKSKKAFKPKAPQPRRAEGPASVTNSVRGSQEPQRPGSHSDSQHAFAAGGRGVSELSASRITSPQPSTRSHRSPEIARAGSTISEQSNRLAQPIDLQHGLPTPSATQQTSSQVGKEQRSQREGAAGSRSNLSTQRPNKKIRTAKAAVPIYAPNQPPTPQATQAAASGTAQRRDGTDVSPDASREQGATALVQLSQDSSRNGTAQTALQSDQPVDQASGKPQRVHRDEAKRGPSIRVRGKKDAGVDGGEGSRAKEDDSRGVKRRRKPGHEEDQPVSSTLQRRSTRIATRLQDEATEDGPSVQADTTNTTAAQREAGTDAVTKPAPRQAKSKRKTARAIGEQADAIVAAAVGSRAKGKRRGRKDTEQEAVLAAESPGNDGSDSLDDGASRADSGNAQMKGGHRKRQSTPEDAETMEINVHTQMLGDLPKVRTGRLGPRELKLRERDEQQAVEEKERRQAAAREEMKELMAFPEGEERDKAKEEKAERLAHEKEEAQEREEREAVWRIEDEGEWSFKPRGRWGQHKKDGEENAADSQGGPNGDREGDDAEQDEREDSPFQNVFHSSGAGFRIIDGQIVANPNARTLDAPIFDQAVEERVQTDIDRRVTEASFAYREARGRWNPDKLELFYEGLRRWGTDFGMVATWVPGMSRNQVKRKFNQEERANPELVLDALKKENRIPTTLDEVQEKRGRPLKDPKEWQRDMDRREAEMRERAKAEKEAAAELLRTRGEKAGVSGQEDGDGGSKANETNVRESIEADGADATENSTGKGSGPGRGRGRGRKSKAAGPEVVNMGMW